MNNRNQVGSSKVDNTSKQNVNNRCIIQYVSHM